MCLKIQLDGGVAPGTLRRRAAIAWPLASLNSNCHQVQQGTIACTESCRVIEISRPIEVVQGPGLISFLKPPHSTEGYPSWQLRTKDENNGIFPLRIHRFFKECAPAGDSHGPPVEIKCNAAGKRVRLQWEWCAPRRAHL